MRISLGYSDSEDRVWIRTDSSDTLWWLTRRLALRLIARWAEVLQRSLQAPAGGSTGESEEEAAARRSEALRREHVEVMAVAQSGKVPPVSRPAPGAELANTLLASVEISGGPRGLRLVLHSPGRSETLRMSRGEAHRLLHSLHARCSRSGWYASDAPGWLAETPSADRRPGLEPDL